MPALSAIETPTSRVFEFSEHILFAGTAGFHMDVTRASELVHGH
jgi:hypothetical protein